MLFSWFSWFCCLAWPARKAPAPMLVTLWWYGCDPETTPSAVSALSGALFCPGMACPTMCWFGKNGNKPIPAAAAAVWIGGRLDAAVSHKWRNFSVRQDSSVLFAGGYVKWPKKHIQIYFTAITEHWLLVIAFSLLPSWEQTLLKANSIKENPEFSH